MVTESDRSAERLIRRTLLGARPDDAVVGEEGDDEPGTSGVRWIVDPIDGTVNFLYGIPQYAVSIAAELDGEVVAGVVLNVATGTSTPPPWAARRSATAYRSGSGAVVPLAERLIGTGFSYEAHQREIQAAALLHLLPRIRDIRRFGSCALDLCGVAQGSLDGYVEEGVNLWDHAAGGLIAQAAGARVETDRGVGGRLIVMRRSGGRVRRVQDCDRRGWVPRGTDRLVTRGIGARHRMFNPRIVRRCVRSRVDGAQSSPADGVHVGLGDDRRE